MEMKDKKIEELNKKYNTDGVCSGIALKAPFVVLMQQLKENYEDIDFFYDDSFSRF